CRTEHTARASASSLAGSPAVRQSPGAATPAAAGGRRSAPSGGSQGTVACREREHPRRAAASRRSWPSRRRVAGTGGADGVDSECAPDLPLGLLDTRPACSIPVRTSSTILTQVSRSMELAGCLGSPPGDPPVRQERQKSAQPALDLYN